MFEGKYLDGKRNGKGIEYKFIPERKKNHCYYLSNIGCKEIKIFEGEYLNRERKEGKEYNYNENLVYEGEYLNGKRNGKGKLYDNGNLIYEGELINDFRYGKGIEYDRYNNIKYECEYIKDKKNGKGKEYNYKDKLELLLFEGEYFNNFRVRGKEYYKNGKLK